MSGIRKSQESQESQKKSGKVRNQELSGKLRKSQEKSGNQEML